MSSRNKLFGKSLLHKLAWIGLAASFLMVANCCHRHHRCRKPHHFHGRWRGPHGPHGRKMMWKKFAHMRKMGGKMGMHRFKMRIHMMKKFLGLTDAQVEKLKALHKDFRAKVAPLRLKKRQLKIQMMGELLKVKPDLAKLEQIFKAKMEAKMAKKMLKFKKHTSFIQILTADQWRKLISSPMFKHMKFGGKCKGCAGGRPGGWGRGFHGGWHDKWRGMGHGRWHHGGKPCPHCKKGKPCPHCMKGKPCPHCAARKAGKAGPG